MIVWDVYYRGPLLHWLGRFPGALFPVEASGTCSSLGVESSSAEAPCLQVQEVLGPSVCSLHVKVLEDDACVFYQGLSVLEDLFLGTVGSWGCVIAGTVLSPKGSFFPLSSPWAHEAIHWRVAWLAAWREAMLSCRWSMSNMMMPWYSKHPCYIYSHLVCANGCPGDTLDPAWGWAPRWIDGPIVGILPSSQILRRNHHSKMYSTRSIRIHS